MKYRAVLRAAAPAADGKTGQTFHPTLQQARAWARETLLGRSKPDAVEIFECKEVQREVMYAPVLPGKPAYTPASSSAAPPAA